MANFDTGIKGYVKAQATVDVYFPIDFKGVADISCSQCPYLWHNNLCMLNKELIAYPSKYVGQNCPLEQIEVVDNG